MDDEIRRKTDLENLTKIPLIEDKVDRLIVSVDNITSKMDKYNGIKVDVDWLKKFFWIIAMGTGTALVLAVLKIVMK